MENLLKRRFAELMEEAHKLEASKRTVYDQYENRHIERIDSNQLLTWKVKAKSLIACVCGADSVHFKHFEDSESSPYSTELNNLRRMLAVFLAAKEDFEGGYLVSMRSLVQAEVFDSELEQASEFLRLNHHAPAAVIAGTVLETALRDLCTRNQIEHGKLDKMNADLAKAAVYNSIVQKRIIYLAAVRNSAAHGKEAEFKTHDVTAMISEVEQFLANHCL